MLKRTLKCIYCVIKTPNDNMIDYLKTEHILVVILIDYFT